MTDLTVQEPSSAPRTPTALLQRFSQLVSSGDLTGLLALYEPGALFAPQPGVVHTGRDAIGAALAQLLALKPTMETVIKEVHCVDDIALAIVEWVLRGRAPDGSEVLQRGTSADVLRRQPDGSFRVLIDHP